MTDEALDAPARPASAAVDSRLRCPECEYNLTGLTRARCPECGARFDWNEVTAARDDVPHIAFEAARGWRKASAFFITWATVLFTPWIFARQVVARFSVRHGLIFGLLCFIPVTARYALDWPIQFETYLPWLLTAAAYVLLQAALLSMIDPGGWRAPGETFRFWLAVGGYTTAIVATEFWQAAPLLAFSDIVEACVACLSGQADLLDFPGLLSMDSEWLGWLQLGVWLAGLACCYWRRLHQSRVRPLVRALAAPAVVVLLLLLYSFCVERIGVDFLYGRVFDKLF